jgi:cytochrome c-550 PedF
MNPRLLKLSAVCLLLAGVIGGASQQARAHGDTVPQAVDTTGLDKLGDKWRDANPYRGNPKAVEIGKSAYNQNCARCHGLEVVSGGIAPDLRFLDKDDLGDEWFKERYIGGSVRNGNVYMPAFGPILGQEAGWAIRSYLDTVRQD